MSQVRASHILLMFRGSQGSMRARITRSQQEARSQIEDLKKQLEEGADFTRLARRHSDCPSKRKGGDLGFFTKGRMVPALEKAAFDMDKGMVSGLVETRFGYHIIKVTDRKQAGTTSFEQAKAGIIQRITQRKQQALINKYIESLKADAKIVYPPGKEPKPAAPPMTVPQPK